MKTFYNQRKPILLTLLIIVTFILIVLTSVSLYRDFEDDEVMSIDNKIYGTVLERGSNYVKLQDLDGYNYMIRSQEDLDIGDFVVAYFEKDDRDFSGKSRIELIAKEQEILIGEKKDDVVTTKEMTTIEHQTNTTKVETNKIKTTSTKAITSLPLSEVNEEEIVSYFSSEYDAISTYSNDQTLKEKAKEKFITFVDFIFYDGEIKGKKFNDLTATVKAKVIYYTLLLDAKIDSKWPDYKKNIDNKYNDIKARLIAKYMEITTSICENNQDNCTNVKNDFNLLKKSVGLTWGVIKRAFSYAYNSGKEHLVKWYEVFSGKI